ncbi:hypothetical protein IQ249_02230 [Lusitaniella coriacea LEGE 07157]|uniref:Uncharacterized protein n=1 Tax=Lusitaniella coriacea LEGE 07157 TaxID=945747 RepID=A0A8J7B6X5_9CYAN|nr:hypothetical protein [Lusitaniella coriacea]MBE9114706.1 hypothetical protein [Lusitaniella coriacea LEGE 07157]
MLGLSITAIGLRPFEDCLNIFQTLQEPLHLDFLELAIGSQCPVEFDYPNIPLILHNSCLYRKNFRLRLNLLRPKTWQAYADFIANHDVRAVSLHPPRQRDCTKQELEIALLKLEEALNIPVYTEVMPSPEYWCSSEETLVDRALLVDVSHILIWHRGDRALTQQTCLNLLDRAGAIHLSHNSGYADTHDLIPQDIWFTDCIQNWARDRFVTYESLPIAYGKHERLDKLSRRAPLQHNRYDTHKTQSCRALPALGETKV